MKVGVIGTGYVGLVSGVCFAEVGHDVVCVDIDDAKIERLRNGEVPIYEPGLEELLERNIREKRIAFTTSVAEMLDIAQVVFIAVGTPTGEDGSADLKYVLAAASGIGDHMADYKVVVNKSTVPVGTGAKVERVISESLARRKADIPFSVVSNPEFLKEGAAILDFMKPDRIVIGANDAKSAEIMRKLYSPFVRNENPVLMMDRTSAELTKYAANGFLATKISFINEIANLAERVGANIDYIRKGIGSDTRIGKQFLYPGPGYGGSCFPKDVKALISTAREYGQELEILQAVEDVNNRQKKIIGTKLQSVLGNLTGKKIAVWGLAFKAKTDDIRESPALDLISFLLEAGAKVSAFDPEAMENTRRIFGERIEYAGNYYETLPQADALAIVTEWPEFRNPDFERLRKLMKTPVIVDGRNQFLPEDVRDAGFIYHSIGRLPIGG